MRRLRRHADRSYSQVLEVCSQSKANDALAKADVLVLVVRGVPRTLKMRCPCGCSDLLTIPIDPALETYWNLAKSSDGTVSLSPSVWRESGCRSHFILWNNAVFMCSRWALYPRMKMNERQEYFDKAIKQLFDEQP